MSTRSNSAYPCVSDCTLWPFRVDTHFNIAVASRTTGLEGEIFFQRNLPGVKELGSWLQSASGVQYSDIMFFHDEQGNVVEVSRLEVHCGYRKCSF
uniref:Uncharacterized protein n=1 Tax=Denticeps clupeoides TaxID=299321 RepID=A0AAY4CCX5_9TELE